MFKLLNFRYLGFTSQERESIKIAKNPSFVRVISRKVQRRKTFV